MLSLSFFRPRQTPPGLALCVVWDGWMVHLAACIKSPSPSPQPSVRTAGRRRILFFSIIEKLCVSPPPIGWTQFLFNNREKSGCALNISAKGILSLPMIQQREKKKKGAGAPMSHGDQKKSICVRHGGGGFRPLTCKETTEGKKREKDIVINATRADDG